MGLLQTRNWHHSLYGVSAEPCWGLSLLSTGVFSAWAGSCPLQLLINQNIYQSHEVHEAQCLVSAQKWCPRPRSPSRQGWQSHSARPLSTPARPGHCEWQED